MSHQEQEQLPAPQAEVLPHFQLDAGLQQQLMMMLTHHNEVNRTQQQAANLALQREQETNDRLREIDNVTQTMQKNLNQTCPKYEPGTSTWRSYLEVLDMWRESPECAGMPPFCIKLAIRVHGISTRCHLPAYLRPKRTDTETVDEFLERLTVAIDGELYTLEFQSQFAQRKQGLYESVETYFHMKKELFESAYPPSRRDPAHLYTSILHGLVNDEVMLSCLHINCYSV